MNQIAVNLNKKKSQVSRMIYGHFSEHLGRCIYEGLFVGKDSTIPNLNGLRSDVIKALCEMKIPVLRWPGGCFADEYHWKDGIGALSERKRMVNTNWGGVVEDNSFGTHEFMELCELLGCEPYINGNVGSGEVAEMQEWVEYMTFGGESPMANLRKNNGREKPWKLKYFGIGNENWGCGGNMSAPYYVDVYKRYATYVKNYDGNEIYKIICGPGTDYGHNNVRQCWTRTVMENARNSWGQLQFDGIAIHYYTLTGSWTEGKGSAVKFTPAEYYTTLRKAVWLDEIISQHKGVIRRFDHDNKVKIIFDEWGTWHDVEEGTNPGFLYQQNTMRDALVAALSLHIFNSHADIVHMANIAQLVNVLQAVILTDKDKMLLTPTYHVFRMFKEHQDAMLLESHQLCGESCEGVPAISHSATMQENGSITLTICNTSSTEAAEVSLSLLGRHVNVKEAEILCGDMDVKNTFELPEAVKPAEFTAYKLEEHNKTGTQMTLSLPPCSIVKLIIN